MYINLESIRIKWYKDNYLISDVSNISISSLSQNHNYATFIMAYNTLYFNILSKILVFIVYTITR